MIIAQLPSSIREEAGIDPRMLNSLLREIDTLGNMSQFPTGRFSVTSIRFVDSIVRDAPKDIEIGFEISPEDMDEIQARILCHDLKALKNQFAADTPYYPTYSRKNGRWVVKIDSETLKAIVAEHGKDDLRIMPSDAIAFLQHYNDRLMGRAEPAKLTHDDNIVDTGTISNGGTILPGTSRIVE